MSKRSKKKDEDMIWTSTAGLPKWNQSPIDLNRMYTLHQKFPYLLLQGHLSNTGCAKMTNTGSTVKIEFCSPRKPCLLGGPLGNEYEFSELQFRWGPNNARGAEHLVEGAWYSMEAQMVHWNTNYESIDKCYEKSDGIAIMSFFFQVIGCPSMIDNPNLTTITDNLRCIKIPETSIDISGDCLKWMMEPCSTPGYFTYNGSLTTPPYNECVTWIVVPRAVKISAQQADEFRSIYNEQTEKILRNYRSEQRIHTRKIFFATDQQKNCKEMEQPEEKPEVTENELKTLTRKKQSPVDINEQIAIPKKLEPLILIGHWLNDGEATLHNDGTYPILQLGGDRIPSIIKGGPLNDEYEFTSAHFHWGEDDCFGSEHTVNGAWFSMEAHLVHWNRKYRSFEECLKYEDGLCILAYLFVVKKTCDCLQIPYSPLEKVTDNLRYIKEPGYKTTIAANSLGWVRSATNFESYYFYKGSYNKGDYPECVIWIVFPDAIPIRPDQLAEFRKLQNEKGEVLEANNREIQHLHDRKIYKAVPMNYA